MAEVGEVLIADRLRPATAKLEAHLAGVEVEGDAAEDFEEIGAEQERRPVVDAEHGERRHVGEGERNVAQRDRTEPQLANCAQLQVDGLARSPP